MAAVAADDRTLLEDLACHDASGLHSGQHRSTVIEAVTTPARSGAGVLDQVGV